MTKHMTPSVAKAVKALLDSNGLSKDAQEVAMILFAEGFPGTFKELLEVASKV
jgi:hypothetical protein